MLALYLHELLRRHDALEVIARPYLSNHLQNQIRMIVKDRISRLSLAVAKEWTNRLLQWEKLLATRKKSLMQGIWAKACNETLM